MSGSAPGERRPGAAGADSPEPASAGPDASQPAATGADSPKPAATGAGASDPPAAGAGTAGSTATPAASTADAVRQPTEEMPRVQVTRRRTLLFAVFVVSALAFLYVVLPQLGGVKHTWD